MSGASEIKTVAVIGTGVIGASYAALFLAHGLTVIVSPSKAGGKELLKAAVAKTWPTLEKMGLVKANASQENLEFVDDLFKHFDRIDFVQENGPETLPYKIDLFSRLDAVARPDVPLVSSTSGFPSSKFIGSCTHHPERVLIGHPVNPPHLIPAVEVVPHPGTSSAIVDKVYDFFKLIGQEPIRLNTEVPGFLINRLQLALVNEAFSLLYNDVVNAADLDRAMTSALGLRWAFGGPVVSAALGGGGGLEGFKRILEHIGPAAVGWRDDMDKRRIMLTDPATKEALVQKVALLYESGYDEKEFVSRKDLATVELIALKKSIGEGHLP